MHRLTRFRDFYLYFRKAEYPNGRWSSFRMALPYLSDHHR